MVVGLERWKEYFKEYEDKYVLIGGAACNIWEEEVNINPRATKDLDVVLIVEALTVDFGKRLWDFIKDANYANRNKGGNTYKHEYYRFMNPKDKSYPKQIELFARNVGILNLPLEAHIEPISIGEDLSSLSAILMDDDYYSYTLDHSISVDGIHLARPEALICLKAKAFVEMLERENNLGNVDSRDIEKHKKDIFRLLAMLPQQSHFDLPNKIRLDIEEFYNKVGELPNSDFFKSSRLVDLNATKLLKILQTAFL